MSEWDSKGKTVKGSGLKFDGGKSPVYRGVLNYFPRALDAIAQVSKKGAEKYAWNDWEKVEDGQQRYEDGLGRHILGEAKGELYSSDNLLHKAQRAWNDLASLELFLRDHPDLTVLKPEAIRQPRAIQPDSGGSEGSHQEQSDQGLQPDQETCDGGKGSPDWDEFGYFVSDKCDEFDFSYRSPCIVWDGQKFQTGLGK